MSKTALVFIGPPGSGKGTQASLIADKYHALVISSGEIYRNIIKQNDPLSLKVKKYVESGGLVPDDLHSTLINNKIDLTQANILILDGVIRNLAQKINIEAHLAQIGYNKIYAVYIDLSDLEATRRMKLRGRTDDQPEVITNRLKKYHQETDDVIAKYREENHAIVIDGSPAIAIVNSQIDKKLEVIINDN